MLENDSRLYEIEAFVLCLLLSGLLLVWLTRTIRARRPHLDVGLLLGVAFGVRVAVVVAQSVLGSTGETLRLTDDPTSFAEASRFLDHPLSDSIWQENFFGELHLVFFSGQLWLLGGPGGTSLRVVQALIAVVAIALLALAVDRLAGARAALVAGWFVALEPTSVLFTTLLHKESLVLLGEGLFVLGAAYCWSRRDLRGAPLLAAGCALVLLVRPYAGYFLVAAGLGLVVYMLMTGIGRSGRTYRALAAAICLGAVAVAAVGSGDPLQTVQSAQNEDPVVNDNLQLEPVDFTTVPGLAKGLPRRIRDFLLRPYPWQAANLSQRLGVAGTLIAWSLYLLLAYGLVTAGRAARIRAGPLLWLSAVLAVCYAVSTANAGAGYRHRIQLLFALSGALAILFADRLPSAAELRSRARRRLAPTTQPSGA